MTTDLKPYPQMKDSGVPWLGEVPEHWGIRQLRTLLQRVSSRNRPDLALLSVVREKGVILRDTDSKDENHNFIPDDLANYKVVRPGQFVMNKMKAWQGSYGVSPYEGLVSPAYFVFDLSDVGGSFFHSAIRSRAYVPFFAQASDGVRIGQWDLAETRMRSISFILPPPSEQAAMVRYLGTMDRRIGRYIRAKQRLIALLEEQKQAIIHQAVTRGLDPNVRLKPSGIEWIGDIPEHWEVRRLGQAARVFNGTTPSRMQPAYWQAGTVPWLSSGKVNEYVVEVASELVTERALRECSISLVPRGSVVMGLIGQGKTRGKSALLAIDASINQNLAAMVPRQELDGRFLHLALTAFYKEIRELGRGGNQEALNCDIVSRIRLPIPRMHEQTALVDCVSGTVAKLESARRVAQRAIALLREYRTRLIADVVTGKLDVRAAAAGLPDEAAEPAPLDAPETLDDAEDGAGDDLDAVAEASEDAGE